NLQEKVCSVISDAGYVPETELDYGVNWAYMENRMDSADPITFVILAGVVGVILLTGYLIIYNIFQISVMNDIRFYGLLKTIGTTKKQLKKIITFQAMLLSLIGIPIGIFIGYGVGKLVLPFAMNFTENGQMEISLKFNPFILLFSVFFSVMTVYLSCRRPGKIAGSVSPVEAVRYTEGRNKKKSWVVIMAISLSMILLTFVMTAVGSFRLDSYLESRIVGDFLLGSNGIFSVTSISDDYAISEDYMDMADGAEGIISKDELWARFDNYVKLDEKGINQYKKLDEEGKLRKDEYTEDMIEWVIEGKEDLRMYSYGYTNNLLEKLKVLEGTLDIEKFQEGDYILIGRFHGSETLEASDGLYHPGDHVKVAGIVDGAKLQEIEKVYEVMAVVDIPYSMDLHRYTANAMDVVLPLRAFTESKENSVCFALSYKVEKEKQEAFEAMLKDYTENTNKFMGYASKNSLKQEFDGMIKVIAVIGISLATVIAFIGILNFVNAMITDIISRKREFAVLQSIGMTGNQLVRMLILEGVRYVAAAGVISFIVGSLLARIILGALNNVIMFFEYQFQIMPFIMMLPVLLIVAVIVPVAAWHRLQKKSIVERLRENE
ncbi:MAG: ABC transporter permease, partial [Frisingicoccus sp.]|uniref:ABC transporter permease n=1 Tax=Frisingicoccus sp. TaxID=1918627 RepID=UPI00262F3069